MKKLFLIFAIALSFNAFSQETTVTVGIDKNVRYEVVSDSLKQVLTSEAIELLKDSTFRDELVYTIKKQYQNKPEAGSDFWVWITYILGIITTIGAIINKIPTSSALKWLQPVQEICRFLAKHIFVPENRAKNGGTHN